MSTKRRRFRKDVLIRVWWHECRINETQLYRLKLYEKLSARESGHLGPPEGGWYEYISADLLFEEWKKWAEKIAPFYRDDIEKRGFMLMFCRVAASAIIDKRTLTCGGKRTQVVFFAPLEELREIQQGEAA